MRSHELNHTVPLLDQVCRLDKYLADTLALFPRTQYDRRQVTVSANGKVAKPSLKLIGGESLAISWLDLPEISFAAEDIPLSVIFEDETVMVINKARGMVVHPAHGNWTGTLVQALLYRVKDLAENFEEEDDVYPREQR